ncbi:LytR C-terminal domain-containing protein [Dietzia sp. PP-33]|uniref:LytR C-terminal domain-containing protein n=1 Tax=Dietzia sp. PP-33 TaxID=2957500 RepID=UPI0029B53D50|nr:LytR C-terminal domain-containing protein [Dietzia sp. PP-33]MDX2356134.1 LytR C-terminal domain-containing protein [Dietzia sp. PP-33]
MSTQSETSQYDPSGPGAPGGGPGGGPDPDEPTGPPYRAIAMVLLAAVVLAIGIGLVQLFGGDDETPTATDEETSQVEQTEQQGRGDEQGRVDESGQPGDAPAGQDPQGAPDGQAATGAPGQPAQQPTGQPPAGEPGAAPAVTAVPVQVFNNSNVTGLAGRTGEALRESGFAVGDVANLPSNQPVVAESTVYFGNGAGEQQAARAIADQLGIPALPRPADLEVQAPGVIVIVTQDLNR